MYKIIFSLLCLTVLLFPQVEAFAKDVPVCPDNSPMQDLGPVTVLQRDSGSRIIGGTCTDNDAVCARRGGKGGVTEFYCYKPSDPAAAAAATSPDCSKPENAGKCTGGKGLQCKDGKVVATGGDGIMTAIGCVPTEPQKLVEGLLKYGTFASGGIAFLMMILGAIQMITAEGNPESIKHAQERFYSAIIGLLLIIFAVLLMQVIGVDILGLPGFGK